jgi:hypothetical protein
MGDVLRTIFGGSESNASGNATSTPINFTDPSLKALSPDLANSLKALIGSLGKIGNDPNAGVGAPVPQAGITGQETNLLNSNAIKNPGADAGAYIKDVLGGKYLPGQEGANPFFDAAVRAAQRPTFDALSETLGRTLPGRFTAAGGQFIQPNTGGDGGSSAFDRAAAIATRGATQTAGDIAAKMGSDAYTSERTNQNVAAGLDQAQVDTTVKALQASALPRLIQQNGIDTGLALFQQQTKNLLDLLKTIGAVQAPTIANQGVSNSQQNSTSDKGIFPALFPKGIGGGSGG